MVFRRWLRIFGSLRENNARRKISIFWVVPSILGSIDRNAFVIDFLMGSPIVVLLNFTFIIGLM